MFCCPVLNCQVTFCDAPALFSMLSSEIAFRLSASVSQTGERKGLAHEVVRIPAKEIAHTDGNFYGTTVAGGAPCIDNAGCGAVFKVTPSGTLTTLYSF
jgi:uncharacterized repeat protein (TIGR03803 family)